MIYLHSISAGNMEILRLNKFVHEEASEFITKHGVLRINLGVRSRAKWAALSSRPCIQHLEFRIDTRLCNSFSRLAALEEFAYSQIAGDECLIIFNYGKEEVASPYSFNSLRVFLVLQCLFSFNTVIFQFVVEKHEDTELRGRLTEEQFRNDSQYETRLAPQHQASYREVREFLGLGLGPAEFNDSVEGHGLVFYPILHQRESLLLAG